MTTKRQWKARALAAETLVEHLQVTLAETADRGIEDWCAGYDQYQEHLTAERDAAIAQRDLARDAAAALEGDYAVARDRLWRALDALNGAEPLAEWERDALAEHNASISQPWPNVGGARLDQPDLGVGFVNGGES